MSAKAHLKDPDPYIRTHFNRREANLEDPEKSGSTLANLEDPEKSGSTAPPLATNSYLRIPKETHPANDKQ